MNDEANVIVATGDWSEHRLESERDRYSTQNYDNHDKLMKLAKADSIIVLLERLVSSKAKKMPDNGEQYLPFFDEKDVHSVFQREFSVLHRDVSCPTFSKFTSIWSNPCSWIKVGKPNIFTKCINCEQLIPAL